MPSPLFYKDGGMTKYLDDSDCPQALYQGRWVDKATFRAFVYSADEKKLANSYREYTDLIQSGYWASAPADVKPTDPINIRSGRKKKHVSNS